MAIDVKEAKAWEFAPLSVQVERGRVRFFSQTIGETNPVYSDVEAAIAAGHPDLLVPPTFFFSLTLERPDPWGFLESLGANLSNLLHGQQSFTYHTLAYAGDELTLRQKIMDVYTKRGGALEFVAMQTDVMRDSELVAELGSILVITNGQTAE